MKAALTGCLHKIELWEDSDVLEVGVFEKSGVFEAVAEEAIEGDVGYPDYGDGGGEGPVRNVTGQEKNKGKSEGMG
jgi:hypothetical protein